MGIFVFVHSCKVNGEQVAFPVPWSWTWIRSMRGEVEKCVRWFVGLPVKQFVYVHQSILGEDLIFDRSCIFQWECWLAKLFVNWDNRI